MKSILMGMTIFLISLVSLAKIIGLDNKNNYDETCEEARELLRKYEVPEEEIEEIIAKTDKEVRVMINGLIFFLLFVLFLIAKFF